MKLSKSMLRILAELINDGHCDQQFKPKNFSILKEYGLVREGFYDRAGWSIGEGPRACWYPTRKGMYVAKFDGNMEMAELPSAGLHIVEEGEYVQVHNWSWHDYMPIRWEAGKIVIGAGIAFHPEDGKPVKPCGMYPMFISVADKQELFRYQREQEEMKRKTEVLEVIERAISRGDDHGDAEIFNLPDNVLTDIAQMIKDHLPKG